MLTPREIRKGYWMETRAAIPCAVFPDGLLVIFKLADCEAKMDQVYPHGKGDFGQKIWFFNDTRDRECAEQDGDRVLANPRVLHDHFTKESTQ